MKTQPTQTQSQNEINKLTWFKQEQGFDDNILWNKEQPEKAAGIYETIRRSPRITELDNPKSNTFHYNRNLRMEPEKKEQIKSFLSKHYKKNYTQLTADEKREFANIIGSFSQGEHYKLKALEFDAILEAKERDRAWMEITPEDAPELDTTVIDHMNDLIVKGEAVFNTYQYEGKILIAIDPELSPTVAGNAVKELLQQGNFQSSSNTSGSKRSRTCDHLQVIENFKNTINSLQKNQRIGLSDPTVQAYRKQMESMEIFLF
jgi:hypothetical protein